MSRVGLRSSHRLRSEKTHRGTEGRGFDSPHLHGRAHLAWSEHQSQDGSPRGPHSVPNGLEWVRADAFGRPQGVKPRIPAFGVVTGDSRPPADGVEERHATSWRRDAEDPATAKPEAGKRPRVGHECPNRLAVPCPKGARHLGKSGLGKLGTACGFISRPPRSVAAGAAQGGDELGQRLDPLFATTLRRRAVLSFGIASVLRPTRVHLSHDNQVIADDQA